MKNWHSLFKPETRIHDVLRQHPQTVPVFLRHRVVCVGCWMSKFDTIADAVWNYGLDMEAFLSELSAAAETTSFSENQQE